MGTRVITGFEEGNVQQPCEVLFCSTSGVAFGPIMKPGEAEPFLQWMIDNDKIDPRIMSVTDLFNCWDEFRAVARKE